MDIDENITNETRLEVEFRQILCIIKKSILYVSSSYNLSFYRAWLEKLNSVCEDRYLRNTYLIRLARQIQGNFLSHPFDKTPPSGPLKIEDIYSEDSDVGMDSVRNGDESFLQEPERLLQMKAAPMSFNQRNLAFYFHNKNSLFSEQIVDNNEWKKAFQPNDDVAEHFEKKMPAKIKKRKLKSNNFKIHEAVSGDLPHPLEEPVRDSRKGKLGNIQEDSSWYDLTDTSLTSIILNPLGSGDAARRTKLHVFKDTIDEIETNVDTGIKQPQISPIPYEEQGNEEYQETTEMKFPLKDTHYISTDWKQTIASLQLRLTETLTQNNELKLTVGNLTAQIQAETKKREEIEHYLKELKEQHVKEIQKIDKMKEESMKKLEESFQQKLGEVQKCYNEKLQEIINDYEIKIKTLKEDNECIKQDKDKEIIRLSQNIQEQCSRITDEIKELRKQMEILSSKNNNSDEKVIDLQRCISKMDKLFHKSEKEYLKLIEKLKQELIKQEKVAQLQLKTQKAELISRTSAEKQRQFDELVNSLEVKYIKMLEYHETEVMENRREDEDRIKYLKHLLQKYDIPYNIS